jgi:hypothetical protein
MSLQVQGTEHREHVNHQHQPSTSIGASSGVEKWVRDSGDFEAHDRDRMLEFLRTELAVAMIFARVAESQRKFGKNRMANNSWLRSEKAFSAVLSFLSDRNCTKHVSAAELSSIMVEMQRIRAKLGRSRLRKRI